MDTDTPTSVGVEKGRLISFFTALRFLTVIPVSWQADKDGLLFPSSIFYFPLIGLLIGAVGLLFAKITAFFFPPAIVAFLLVFYLSAISGFLHLDGLADSADGLLSGRPREQSLAIMKDSRTGAMGVVILVVVLLGKFAALSSLNLSTLAVAVVCMPLAGRCAILVTMASQRYARPEGGLGGLFYSTQSRSAALLGCSLLIITLMVVGNLQTAAVVCLMMIVTVFWFSAFCKTRLGGVTGDTLGAMCELTEMSVAIGLTALM